MKLYRDRREERGILVLMSRTAAHIADGFRPTRGKGKWLRPSLFGVALLAFGLLLWARFLLVTGHPRTAIADPPPPQSTHASAVQH
jgi:hypothetical protein